MRRDLLAILAVGAVLIVAWQAVVVGGGYPPYILPSPLDVFDRVSDPRNQAIIAPAVSRLENFLEVQQGFDPRQAAAEAARCFSCGTCIHCDNCYYHCPDMAITKLERGYKVKTDYCKGCGLCVAECPTGAIIMRDEL